MYKAALSSDYELFLLLSLILCEKQIKNVTEALAVYPYPDHLVLHSSVQVGRNPGRPRQMPFPSALT